MSQPSQNLSALQWLQSLAARSQPQWGHSALPVSLHASVPRQNGRASLHALWQAVGANGWGITSDHLHVDLSEEPTMAGESEFSGFDLALGEVYGLRHWDIDDLGRLQAVAWGAQADFWKPGVNTARCLSGYTQTTIKVPGLVDPYTGEVRRVEKVEEEREKVPVTSWPDPDGNEQPLDVSSFNIVQEKVVRTHVTWYDGTTGVYDGKVSTQQIEITGAHLVPDEHCKCGFYAYSGREQDQHTGLGYIAGVIKGYGRTLIGPKGFRCEKAEIVALLDPTKGGTKDTAKRRRRAELLARNYPEVPQFTSWEALFQFAPLTSEEALPDPSTEEFWTR